MLSIKTVAGVLLALAASSVTQAQTVHYRCDTGGPVTVSYAFGADSGRSTAVIRSSGRTLRLPLREFGGKDGPSTYSNGTYTWSGDGLYPGGLQHSNGFLTMRTRTRVNHRLRSVDRILNKDCQTGI